MAYEQASDILHSIEIAHRRVHDSCFQRQFDIQEVESHRLLVEQLERDHQSIGQFLEDYRRDPEHVEQLKTWIQFTPERAIADCLGEVVQDGSRSFNQLTDAIAGFYRNMEALLQTVQAQVPTEELAELFRDLANLEHQKAKALSKCLLGMEDV